MKYIKKPIPVQVEFASAAGTLQTLEGPVQYEAGDALMTGAANEHWPIRHKRFEETYAPLPTTKMGEAGLYLKKHILVDARLVQKAETIPLGGERGVLNAQTGDWILTAPDGQQWVVSGDIFRLTYEEAG